MFHFYNPWKRQKTKGGGRGGIEIKHVSLSIIIDVWQGLKYTSFREAAIFLRKFRNIPVKIFVTVSFLNAQDFGF